MKNVYIPTELDTMCMDHSCLNCPCVDTNPKVVRDASAITSQFFSSTVQSSTSTTSTTSATSSTTSATSTTSTPSATAAGSTGPTVSATPSRNVAKKHTHPIMRSRSFIHPVASEKKNLTTPTNTPSVETPPESVTAKKSKTSSSVKKVVAANTSANSDITADTPVDASADSNADPCADASEDVDRIVKKRASTLPPAKSNVVQIKITPAMAKMQVFIHPEASAITYRTILKLKLLKQSQIQRQVIPLLRIVSETFFKRIKSTRKNIF